LIAEAGSEIDRALATKIADLPLRAIKIHPVVTNETDYLPADEEDKFIIAQANALLDERFRFIDPTVSCRHAEDFVQAPIASVDYMDVSPKQVVSVSTALIPFLEHDDANRALMGSNMQRQAVPLLRPDAPIIGTGMEHKAARDSGQVVVAHRIANAFWFAKTMALNAPIHCSSSCARTKIPVSTNAQASLLAIKFGLAR